MTNNTREITTETMQGIRDILDVGGSGAGNKKKGGIQVVDDGTQDMDGVYTLLQLSSL